MLLRVVVVLALPVIAGGLLLLVLGVLGVLNGTDTATATGAVSALEALVRAVGDLLRAAVERIGPIATP